MGEADGSRHFLNGDPCAICTRPIERATTKELIRVRGFKFYMDATKEIGTPTTRTRGTWCTDCTLWFMGGVHERREAAQRSDAGVADQ